MQQMYEVSLTANNIIAKVTNQFTLIHSTDNNYSLDSDNDLD